MRIHFLIVIFSLCGVYAYGAIVITGNASDQNTTTQFPIGFIARGPQTGGLYVAAQSGSGGNKIVNDYTVSFLMPGATALQPLAPSIGTINITETSAQNPLFDKGVRAFTVATAGAEELPALLVDGAPQIVVMFEHLNRADASFLISPIIKDALANPVSTLTGLGNDFNGRLFTLAVPASGVVGDAGTGIALIIRGYTGAQNQQQRVFYQLNQINSNVLTADPAAKKLDRTSPELIFGGSELAAMGQTAIFHWDKELQRLFVGLDVTAPNEPQVGIRSIVVGRLENNNLIFSPIAPDAAFTANNPLPFGAVGANERRAIRALTSLHTSTALSYLVTLSADNTVHSFALSKPSESTQVGTIASRLAEPITSYALIAEGTVFTGRVLADAATQPETMPAITDAAVVVGADAVLPGPVSDLTARQDAVFVTVSAAANDMHNGVYYSQALFTKSGLIKGWTQWERAANPGTSVVAASVDDRSGSILSVVKDPVAGANTLIKTEWGNGDKAQLGLLKEFISATSSTYGPITYAQRFSEKTPAIQNVELLLTAGKGWLLLTQLGVVSGTVLTPTSAELFSTVQRVEDGTLVEPLNTQQLLLTGGQLGAVGPITCAAIATDELNNQAWLAVGGTDGIVLLRAQNGAGFAFDAGITQGFGNFVVGNSFLPFGSFANVRSIVADGNFLYVLTDSSLQRINMATSDIAQNQLSSVVLATSESLGLPTYGVLTQLVVSDGLAVLGTTGGLFVVGVASNSMLATQPSEVAWERKELPEGLLAVIDLVPVTQSGVATDLARGAGGYVFVMSASHGTNNSFVHRLAVEPFGVSSLVQEGQIELFDDVRVQNNPTQFLEFGRYKTAIATDGALFFAVSGKDRTNNPSLVLLSPGRPLSVAGPFLGLLTTTVSGSLDISPLVRAITKVGSTGSWLVVDSTGIHLNE